MRSRDTLGIMGGMLVVCLGLAPAQNPSHITLRPKVADPPQPWLVSLAEGFTQAQRGQRPIFVRVGADSCPWCRKLEQVIGEPSVQQELARWTLVALDVDKLPKDARTLAVGAIPALRVLTPAGKVVAAHDGYLPAADLVAWLKKHHPTATIVPLPELTDTQPPTAVGVVRLVAELNSRDALACEAAIRRLRSHADLAAGTVVKAFCEGNLQVRLAALELLQEWKAPVTEFDPWRPETLTAARLESLRKWAADPAKPPGTPPKHLSDAQLGSIREEMARMIQGTESEAAAIRERLAHHGRALLPEVTAQLKDAANDRARERLTALRYRLVTTGALVLGWPGGLDQLAATSAAVRQQAVQDLAKRATAAEEPLLLELFSNPDPLVREISLRALHEVGGSRAIAALAQLLRDPEPNVRAAVLKQLAEQPSPGMVPRIAEYVRVETDPDLLVHAVRVLRGTRGQAASDCLRGLLKHDSWRVRAEAVQGLGEGLGSGSRSDPDSVEVLNADIYVDIIETLKDPDGFVVGRAIEVLQKTDLGMAVEPLVQAARAHPDLAAAVVRTLPVGENQRPKAIPHLRQFCAHANPEVRAAAIAGLCQAAPEAVDKELRAAFQDKASAVRRAAATALLSLLRSQATELARSMDRNRVPAAAPDDWVSKVRNWLASAPKRSAWQTTLVPLLEAMLTAPEPEERLAAALASIALDRTPKAWPVLLEVARTVPALQGKTAEVMHLLPWEKREALFQQLLALKPQPEQLSAIVLALAQIPDRRALKPLWELAAREDQPPEFAAVLTAILQGLYPRDEARGQSRSSFNYNGQMVDLSMTVAERKEAVAAIKQRALAGPETQRVIALVVLVNMSVADALPLLTGMVEDAEVSPTLRRIALQILLVSSPKAEALQTAFAALSSKDPTFRKLAITFLAMGSNALHLLPERQIYVSANNPDPYVDSVGGNGQPILPRPPSGLKADMVRPFLSDSDPQTAACAGYLLALLGDGEGLRLLIQHWRQHAQPDDSAHRLMYRAIAALGDDGLVPILEEIYRGYRQNDIYWIREFYWTIRIMEGPNALRLRKRIRQEVGMDQLR